MDNGNNKKETKLVKVNAGKNQGKRYDAYGYEIPEEKPPRPSGNAVSNTVRPTAETNDTETGSRLAARKNTYDADIRSAIEQAAHRQTGASGSASGTEEGSGGTRTVSTGTAAGAAGAAGTYRRASHHELIEEEYTRTNGNGSGTRSSGTRTGSGTRSGGSGSSGGSRSGGTGTRSGGSGSSGNSRSGGTGTSRSGGSGSSGGSRSGGSGSSGTSRSGSSGSGTRSGGSGSSGSGTRSGGTSGSARYKSAADKKRAMRKAQKKAKKEAKAQAKKQKQEEAALLEKRELTPHEKRIQYKKQERRRAFGKVLKVAAVLLIVALIIMLIVVNTGKHGELNTQYLSSGFIEDASEGTLSFLRSETPVYAGYSGIFTPNVNEGERVAVNAVIGYIVKPEYSEALKELKETESKINAARKAASYVDASKSGEILALEDAIESGIDELARIAMSGGLTGYGSVFTELDELFARKNELEMNAETTDTYISGLQKERNSILNRISSSMHEVRTNVAGIISFYTDGNENAVTEASKTLGSIIANTNFSSKQSSTLSTEELASVSLPGGSQATLAGQNVQKGTAVARIATETSYYVTMPVENVDSHQIVSGAVAEVYAPGENLRFEAETVGVYYYSGGKAFAVFKASRALDSTVTLRSIEGRIIFSHIEGLKVPLRALTDWDKAGVTARITVVRSGYVRYAYVNVLARDNDYAVINNRSTLDDGTGLYVRENEEYVVNYDKVYEGQEV